MATMLKPDPYFGKKSFRMNKELKTRAGISTVTKGMTQLKSVYFLAKCAHLLLQIEGEPFGRGLEAPNEFRNWF